MRAGQEQAILLRYRRDIDGLRAIAVLPVVLFHAGLGFPGGFVGVDVFFVISGYLITSLISEEIAAGHFSVLNFYERRIRRIFPALFTVIGGSSVLAVLLFMPSDLLLFGRSVRAAALFYSNVLFQNETGYFDALEAVKPLLHTWSLAVEEQFYIFVPLLLWLLRRKRRLQIGVLLGLIVGSTVLSEWWVFNKPALAFYQLPSRFWELGLGVALAYVVRRQAGNPIAGAALTFTGLSLITAASLFFDSSTPFPGLLALVPCIGAALVIFGGFTPNPVTRVLSLQPLAFIGLISYSLYLWHWPFLVFSQYQLGRSLTSQEALAVVVASLVAAAMSWKFIEAPFRRRDVFVRKSSLLAMGLAVVLATCCFGLTIKLFHGFPGRLPERAASIYAAKEDISKYSTNKCFTDSKLSGPTDDDVRNGRLCSMGDENTTNVSFIVWGDSHSGALAPGIDKAAAKYGQKGLLVGQGGCPPLLDYQTKQSRKSNRESCVARNDAALDFIRREHVSLVFLIARWPREVLGAEYGREGPLFDPAAPYETEDRSQPVSDALDRTLTALAQLHCRVVLVMDVPEPGYDVPYALARAVRDHRTIDVNPSRTVVAQRQYLAINMLKLASAKHDTELVDPTARFCSAARCDAERDGRPLYVDADHLTRTAALALSPLFDHSFSTTDLNVSASSQAK